MDLPSLFSPGYVLHHGWFLPMFLYRGTWINRRVHVSMSQHSIILLVCSVVVASEEGLGLNRTTRQGFFPCHLTLNALLTPKCAVDQAFTYSTYTDVNGPLVFIPKSGWINSGQGPGQHCLSAEQDVLGTALCNPAMPAPQQQFYIGSTWVESPS